MVLLKCNLSLKGKNGLLAMRSSLKRKNGLVVMRIVYGKKNCFDSSLIAVLIAVFPCFTG